MRATKYFKTKEDMFAFAKQFCEVATNRWFVKTKLRCDHVLNQKRTAVILNAGETMVQRIITCKICNVYGNAVDMKGGTANE
ncbi:MAG: hypothetical protein QM486_11575 [Flavobacteriaceae bacterium]